MEPDDLDTNSEEYVYLPEEDIYGTIIKKGAWSSTIEYFDMGIRYTVELPNEDFQVVDDIGLDYIDETGDDF